MSVRRVLFCLVTSLPMSQTLFRLYEGSSQSVHRFDLTFVQVQIVPPLHRSDVAKPVEVRVCPGPLNRSKLVVRTTYARPRVQP